MNEAVEKLKNLRDDLDRVHKDNGEALDREHEIAEDLTKLRHKVHARYNQVAEHDSHLGAVRESGPNSCTGIL